MTTVTILGLAVAVAAPLPKERSKPVQSAVGDWVFESVNGRLDEDDKEYRYRFREDGTYVISYRSKEYFEAKYVTDLKRNPATIDLELLPGPFPYTLRAIFKVDGDLLTIYGAPNDHPRPTEFELPADEHHVHYVFKRVKKE